MNNNSDSAAKTVLLVMAAYAFSKGFGFIRDIIMAGVIGTSHAADAYNVVFAIPSTFFVWMAGAVGTAFMPVYIGIREREGLHKSREYTNNVVNAVLLFGIVVSVFSVIFSKQLISVFAPGFTNPDKAEAMAYAADFANIMFYMFAFLSVVAVWTYFLNANNRFTAASLITVPFSAAVIAALVLYRYGYADIMWIAHASLFGAFTQTLILGVSAFRAGYRFRPLIDFRDKRLRDTLSLAVPIFIGTSVMQVNVIIDGMMASGLPEGSVSALGYANKLHMFVFSVSITAIGTVIFPLMSSAVTEGRKDDFRDIIIRNLNTVAIIIIPITVVLCVFNQPIIRILFERGAFDGRSTSMTGSSLFFYSLGLVFIGYRIILDRAYFSVKDAKTPMLNALLTLGISVTLNFILIRRMAHNGLALSTSIAFAVTAIPYLFGLRKWMDGIDWGRIGAVLIKTLAAASVMGILLRLANGYIRTSLGNISHITEISVLALTALMGTAVYFLLLFAFRTEEIKWLRMKFFPGKR